VVVSEFVDAVLVEDVDRLSVLFAVGLFGVDDLVDDAEPLVWFAVSRGKFVAAEFLLGCGCRVDAKVLVRDPKFVSRHGSWEHPVVAAVKRGDFLLADWFVGRGVCCSAVDLVSLRDCVLPANFVLRLVRNGLVLGELGDLSSQMLQGGYSDSFIRSLLVAGFDPNLECVSGTTALFHARTSESVRLLVAAGANVNHVSLRGSTPLHFAAAAGFEGVVSELLVRGANACAVDGVGRSVLMAGAVGGLGVVGLRGLLLGGADLFARDVSGRCVLSLLVDGVCVVSREGFERVGLAFEKLVFLVGAGGDVNAVDGAGVSVLQRAVRYCGGEVGRGGGYGDESGGRFGRDVLGVVRLLVGAGANVNHVGGGSTVLLDAVMRENEGVVRLLLDAGADVGVRDARGCCVVERVVRERSRGLLGLLVRVGVRVLDAVSARGRGMVLVARSVGFEREFVEVVGGGGV
jgi:ankyrin repeat protein